MHNHCKKYSLIGVVICLWAVNLSAQSPDTLWTRTYGGTNADAGRSVQHTSDGGFIATGNTASFGFGASDVYLVKTDSGGDTIWTKVYGGTSWDIGCSVRQTLDGGYIVAGQTFSFGAGLWDAYLVKTDVNGNFLWAKTYGGPDWDYAYSVEQTTDSGYIICGETWSFGSGNADIYLTKTDGNGNVLWAEAYGDTHRDIGNSVQQTRDGGYIVTGETISYGAGRGDLFLLKTNADGDTMWMRTYGDTLHEKGQSVQQAPDGGYIAVGETWSFSAGKSDIYIIRTDSLGSLIWYKSYGDTHYDYASSIKPTRDGGYIIGGTTWSFGAGLYDVYLLKIDPNGDTAWTMTCGGPGNDACFEVDTISDGGYIAGGWTDSYGAGANDVYLVRTQPEVGIEENRAPGPNPPHSTTDLEVFPNPFCRIVNITYWIEQNAENVDLKIYDVTGRLVKSFALPASESTLPTSVVWNGRNEKGGRMASGIYFIMLRAGDSRATRRVTLLNKP